MSTRASSKHNRIVAHNIIIFHLLYPVKFLFFLLHRHFKDIIFHRHVYKYNLGIFSVLVYPKMHCANPYSQLDMMGKIQYFDSFSYCGPKNDLSAHSDKDACNNSLIIDFSCTIMQTSVSLSLATSLLNALCVIHS